MLRPKEGNSMPAKRTEKGMLTNEPKSRESHQATEHVMQKPETCWNE